MKQKNDTNRIRENALQKSVDYAEYLRMIRTFVQEGRTSGENQSEILVKYTKLNATRMKRLNRTAIPNPSTIRTISDLPFRMEWVVITEAWCGDAAQNLPFIHNLAAACPNVNLRMVFRDENPEYMDGYLTNGSRSIPKWIIYNAENMETLGTWGPQPAVLRKMVLEAKSGANPTPMEVLAERVHRWYTQDQNKALEAEVMEIFSEVTALHPAK